MDMLRDSTQLRRRARPSPAMWAVAALLAVIAACLIVEVSASRAQAINPAVGAAGDGSVLAVAGQITRDTYGLYLVDLKNRTICVYQWVTKKREPKLKLIAARTYAFDRELDEYNTEPSPRKIKGLVGQARRLDDDRPGP